MVNNVCLISCHLYLIVPITITFTEISVHVSVCTCARARMCYIHISAESNMMCYALTTELLELFSFWLQLPIMIYVLQLHFFGNIVPCELSIGTICSQESEQPAQCTRPLEFFSKSRMLLLFDSMALTRPIKSMCQTQTLNFVSDQGQIMSKFLLKLFSCEYWLVQHHAGFVWCIWFLLQRHSEQSGGT